MHTNTVEALKPTFMSSLLYSAVFLKISIFFNHSFILHNSDPKRYVFHIFGFKCCLHYCILC